HRAILCPIFDLVMPHFPISDGLIHLLEKVLWVVGGVEDAVILANQFFSGIFADSAKLLVHVNNRALNIGDSHDSMLIKSELLIAKIFECSLAGGEAFS